MTPSSPESAAARYDFVGHAIVSADGMIAEADGTMPALLRNDADFVLFQQALDRASLVVVGRLGHDRHPNPGRRRLVFTGSVDAVLRDPRDPLSDLFNPAGVELDDVLTRLDVPPGTVAVTGGQRVFDWFLPRYNSFMLAEVHGLALPGGISCFSDGHPRVILAAAGMVPGRTAAIDPASGVTLTRWQRP